MKSVRGDLGFTVRSIRLGDGYRAEAVFKCGCGASHKHFLPRDRTLNPEAAAKRPVADGWKADPFRASVAKCPCCQGAARPTGRVDLVEGASADTGLGSVIIDMLRAGRLGQAGCWTGTARELLTALRAEKRPEGLAWPVDETRLSVALRRIAPALRRGALLEVDMPISGGRQGREISMEFLAMPAAQTAPISPNTGNAREATQAERLKIRSLLDKHFDDAVGCYLEGYSDQKIGTEINVPWALVTRIREAAYGPIRIDPEVAAIRAEAKRLDTAQKALADQVSGLSERIAKYEKRTG